MPETQTNAMAERWERLARDDAMHFIATSRGDWNAEQFYASGQRIVERLMSWLGDRAGRERMLEIGCGLCRTAVHFATHFRHVDAIDISPAMIEQARRHSLPKNLFLAITTGDDLRPFADGLFDLVYSGLVFQHIADDAVIRVYLREIARVLQFHGAAILQFDTRPRSWAVRMYQALPDAMLPRHHRRFIRRYRRNAEQVRTWARHAGLAVVDERSPTSAEHYFLFRRAAELTESGGVVP